MQTRLFNSRDVVERNPRINLVTVDAPRLNPPNLFSFPTVLRILNFCFEKHGSVVIYGALRIHIEFQTLINIITHTPSRDALRI